MASLELSPAASGARAVAVAIASARLVCGDGIKQAVGRGRQSGRGVLAGARCAAGMR